MDVFFIDTSALTRRYDPSEPGSERMLDLCNSPGSRALLISQLTAVELASALNRKTREGRIDPQHRDALWRLFQVHRRSQYRVIAINRVVVQDAEKLIFPSRLSSLADSGSNFPASLAVEGEFAGAGWEALRLGEPRP